MIDLRQTKNYANYLKTQGWTVERREDTNYFIKKIPIIGHILKVQKPKNINLKTIKQLENKYKIVKTFIEPSLGSNTVTTLHGIMLSRGYKLRKSSFLPTKTTQIDLTKSVKEITANMDKKTRYSIRRGEGVKIVDYSSIKKIKKFRRGWKNSVPFSRYVPSLQNLINLRKSFPQNASLFLASHNIYGEIIGGSVFTTSSHEKNNHVTYYMYGFTSNEGRTSLSQYSLLYQGILWARKQGSKLFDMEGIYDNRFPIKSWLGFSHFKKGFGGKQVLYPGCYTKLNIFSK